ncbi:hypothetical protein E2562_011401 [Oryza meyeriana var. granulata]|uniref:Uncharacterized protein n=1 Tax=Oryza meyeriana var. granulata TaxID=110450 RepID=A0A6G1EB29_9ORYZ|nr:hypothetical protein E2562_011401 [Oryza meyeriana var. granulata]
MTWPSHLLWCGYKQRLGAPRWAAPRVLLGCASQCSGLVEQLRAVAIAERAELDEKRSAPVEGDRLDEGCQKLESLIQIAKAFYDRNVAEVKRLRRALAVEREEAIAEREKAEEVADELKRQHALFDTLEVRACTCIQQVDDCETELAHRKEAAIMCHEEAARTTRIGSSGPP